MSLTNGLSPFTESDKGKVEEAAIVDNKINTNPKIKLGFYCISYVFTFSSIA